MVIESHEKEGIMGKEPIRQDKKDWPFESYYRSLLKGEEARQRWLWKQGYVPEIGLFWTLIKLVFRMATYPFSLALRLYRKQKHLREFRAFIRGEEKG